MVGRLLSSLQGLLYGDDRAHVPGRFEGFLSGVAEVPEDWEPPRILP